MLTIFLGIFSTFCMDQLESCVSFLLELALSFDGPDRKFLVPDKEEFHLKMDIEAFPVDAIRTLLALLDEEELASWPAAHSDPRRRSLCDVHKTMDEHSRLSPGQDASSTPEYHGYFQKLEPYELPVVGDGHPTPVSGTWYLGIEGSSAIETGVNLIQQFTSREDELYKLTNYIGFPVRRGFYEDTSGYDLPYHKRFIELADVQKTLIDSPTDSTAKANYEKELLEEGYPLYRMLIDDYENLAPILWRLMVKAAREVISQGPVNSVSLERIKTIITVAAKEYTAVRSPKPKKNAKSAASAIWSPAEDGVTGECGHSGISQYEDSCLRPFYRLCPAPVVHRAEGPGSNASNHRQGLRT